MRPVGEHGPFLGRTWLVTSTPLPPSRVHVMAGLRSFEARRDPASADQHQRQQRRQRRQRAKPPPPPRVSSLQRMRGTVSETDLRRADDRPPSPSTSAYSERQARYCTTILEHQPTYSTFTGVPLREPPGDTRMTPLMEVSVADKTVSDMAMSEISDDAVGEEEYRLPLRNTHERGKISYSEDRARNTTIASIDRILSSMHSLQVALETSDESEPPPLPTPPPTPPSPDQTRRPAAVQPSAAHAHRDPHMSLEDMFCQIEDLYDSLKGKTSDGVTSDSGDIVIDRSGTSTPPEPVYANVMSLYNRIDTENTARSCKLRQAVSVKAQSDPVPEVTGKLQSRRRAACEPDYMACSTPKLQIKRLATSVPVAPPPTMPAPPVPEVQYDVPRPLAATEAVYDTPRVTPVPAVQEPSGAHAEVDEDQSWNPGTLAERANEVFGRKPSKLNTTSALSANTNEGVHSGEAGGTPSPDEHVIPTAAPGGSAAGVRPSVRAVSEARRRAVHLLVGDQLQMPAVPTHDPASGPPARLSGRSTPTRDPATTQMAPPVTGRGRRTSPGTAANPTAGAQRMDAAPAEARSKSERLPIPCLPVTTVSEAAAPTDHIVECGDVLSRGTGKWDINQETPADIEPHDILSKTKNTSNLQVTQTTEATTPASTRPGRSSSVPVSSKPQLPVRSSSLKAGAILSTSPARRQAITLVTVNTEVVAIDADSVTSCTTGVVSEDSLPVTRGSQPPPLVLSVPVSERVQQLQQQLHLYTPDQVQGPGDDGQDRPGASCQLT